MKNININKFIKNKMEVLFILTALVILIYLLISIYFTNHFFFHTVINGVNVSLKTHDEADQIIQGYVNNYKLQLIERNGDTEVITGQDIGMNYRDNDNISGIYKLQNSFKWIISLFKNSKYYVNDMYSYNKVLLDRKMNELKCLNRAMIEPQNVSFIYTKGSYKVIEEVYGNKINKDKLVKLIINNIKIGNTRINLDEYHCYIDPMFNIKSDKTFKTRSLLNKYVSTKVTYKFGDKTELLDGNIINEWLMIDDNLDVVINKAAIMVYIYGLSKKYDTVGIPRSFKTSTGKLIEVKGGIYGWKINRENESKNLYELIKRGQTIVKEPEYVQKAVSKEGNEIGSTYVEISITKQHLWFYKDGKLITQGAVVTGNPNRGFATVIGAYMINYKQKNATLSGPGYDAKVTYWMPFFGNMGIHDATWRHSFGREIYKTRGTHGCVNAPFYMAKTIYENITEGIPVIIYEE